MLKTCTIKICNIVRKICRYAFRSVCYYIFFKKRIQSRWTNFNGILTGIVFYKTEKKKTMNRSINLNSGIVRYNTLLAFQNWKVFKFYVPNSMIFYKRTKLNVIFHETLTCIYRYILWNFCLFVWERLWNELMLTEFFTVILLTGK